MAELFKKLLCFFPPQQQQQPPTPSPLSVFLIAHILDENGEKLASLAGHVRPVADVTWIPGHETGFTSVATASHDETVRIWQLNADTNEPQR